MLEFQEGFFDQEVRDGFYIDTTMKTLWAAELEVLQKVAEICDRHGLKWYAAYGTLLGAIRHEGFVPWDDDMDIWVKRPDYNILMQVLPKELPEGYLVRGPLTDEGYDQYHTCLNSGNGISIAKEWLDQYHGCPFTVGLDIFPLDYLPRNEKDRELQENLLAMTGRIAQLAKNVNRGDYDLEGNDIEKEDKDNKKEKVLNKRKNPKKKKAKTQKELVIEEINLGIDYLEKNCSLQIDHQLLEGENWYKVSSELWKWANYLAMMYGEEESDYLVEFYDYIQCSHKVYPKEWFADGYSATFENFMIPIPAGYDRILQYIYGLNGNYLVRIKKTGTHEYPYYARQLRQLREYVKDIQQRAQAVGIVRIEDIEIKEDTKELLPEWIPLTMKRNGSRKKIVLSANDPSVYAVYGERALDKLEETLHIFEQAKDSVLLWWRPQPVMKKVLDQISTALGERYLRILNHYKETSWGICDETDDIDRAVELCDVYYGEMNAIIQPFQNAGKPVMLSTMNDENAWKENAERFNEYRLFLSFTDFVEDGAKIYFSNTNYNALVAADRTTGTIEKYVPFTEYHTNVPNMHLQCVKQQNRICFLPAGAPCLHIYNMKSGEQKHYTFANQKDEIPVAGESWSYFLQNDQLYLLPCQSAQGLWYLAPHEDTPSLESWWDIPLKNNFLIHGTIDAEHFYSLAVNSGFLYITDVINHTVESISLPHESAQRIAYDGQNFWYTLKGDPDIICWNQKQGIIDTFSFSCDPYYIFVASFITSPYQDIYYADGKLFLISGEGRFLYLLDQETRELRILHTIEYSRGAFCAKEASPYFKNMGNTLICMLRNTGEILIINLNTLEVHQERAVFHADFPIKKAIYEKSYTLLLEKRALLFEEKEVGDLSLLLQYCAAE